jgi:phosphoribosylamine--glycine ligase
MNILVIGSGGREHALCWKIRQSPRLENLYCGPGNGGIAEVAECVSFDTTDHDAVIEFVQQNSVDLVVIGPEAPLVAGLADDLAAADIKAFGPSAAAAMLEGSKGFTKDLCAEFNIPTAAYAKFSSMEPALTYLAEKGAPIVIKADGLAAGKGVVVAMTLEEAQAAVKDMFDGSFGEAGAEVVIEEFLVGEEASFFALTDGESILSLATAQDHKAVGEGDTGPNTGGMGAYSPAPVMNESMVKRTVDEIILPTVRALKKRGTPYKGVLFAGLMITKDGPKLIEYNCRFGDPECQVVMTRMTSDIVPLLEATIDGTLDDANVEWSDDTALTVVMAANGYPGSYNKGSVISGVNDVNQREGLNVFHAGTKRVDNGDLTAIGGRVLNVTATGSSVKKAQARAYTGVDAIDWPDGFCRRDIGWRAID